MPIKKIIVEGKDAYNIPVQLADGSDYTLKLKADMSMSANDADRILQFGLKQAKLIGQELKDSVGEALDEEQMNKLSDQDRASYIDKISDSVGEGLFSESLANKRIVAFVYDVTEEWLGDNLPVEALTKIVEYIQEWVGARASSKK